MKEVKYVCNVDQLKICLLQPDELFENLYNDLINSADYRCYRKQYDGFYLVADKKAVNDKDITMRLFMNDDPNIDLGTFTFNNSQKYGTKCFFLYNTKIMYQKSIVIEDGIDTYKANYFAYPFYAFDCLGLTFNNVTKIEIAVDVNVNAISRIQQAVSDVDTFHMILLGKNVKDPTEYLDGYYEFYQRSRLRKRRNPTLYIGKQKSSGKVVLRVYDKTRELEQARQDKEEIIKVWDDIGDYIQRLEISVGKEAFNRFLKHIRKKQPNRWDESASLFSALGEDPELRLKMFAYFSNDLLHFKVKNHDKTQVSLLELVVGDVDTFQSMKKRNKK